MTLEDKERCREEACCSQSEDHDGMTIGSLRGGCCGSGVVEALSAALGVKRSRYEEQGEG